MLGHREMSFDDYVNILRRRWWILLIPTLLGGAGTYLYSLSLANQYTSRTLVLVEPQKVPDNYVKSVITEDIGQRLGTMQEQILSRTRLQPIIEKFGLFKNEKGKVASEELVEQLRKSILVIPIRSLVSTNAGELPGFSISFTANDPRLAQQVCSEITSMFIEESLHVTEQRAMGTTDFLKNELEEAKRNLDTQDAKLAEFKHKYMGSLPGNEQTDLNMLAGYSSQLDAVNNQLTRGQQDKAYLESLLAQQVSAWQTSQTTGGPKEDALEQQLASLQTTLVSMQARYTPDHPDIVKLQDSIAALKKKIADNQAAAKDKPAESPAAADRPEPPAIQQLRLQIHQTEVMIREKTREQTRIREQLTAYQARLSISPTVEQEYKELTRDYQTALTFYNDLLAKKANSEMATSLVRRQEGEQFQIMDPANLPEKPSYPNRPALAGGGLGVGFALGLAISLFLEFRDRGLRTELDVEHFLGLPTLAMVPDISKQLGKKKTSAPTRKPEEVKVGASA